MKARRQANRDRIFRAARSARAASSWLNRDAMTANEQRILGGKLPAAVRRRVKAAPRVRRRLDDGPARLYQLLLDHPELCGWLDSPHKLEKLRRTLGVLKHGAKLKAFVSGDSVREIIGRIGDPAYRLALTLEGDPVVLDETPTSILDDIEADGTKVADALLRDAAGEGCADLITGAVSLRRPIHLDNDSVRAMRAKLREVSP
jgi:hypothetical protein